MIKSTHTKPGKPGRPSKLTPAVQRRIVDAVETGLPLRLAAASAGVSESTLHAWKREFPQFLEAIKRAEAKFALASVKHIRVAAAKSWVAAAWLLERRFPEEFGRPSTETRTAALAKEPRTPVDPAATRAAFDRIFGIVRPNAATPPPPPTPAAPPPPTHPIDLEACDACGITPAAASEAEATPPPPPAAPAPTAPPDPLSSNGDADPMAKAWAKHRRDRGLE